MNTENMENTTKRQQCVDIARGIAIICIVLGHLDRPEINRIVFTFHVPIFFLITGYFMNQKSSASAFIMKRFKSLIVPYAAACVGIILFALIFNQVLTGGVGDKAIVEYWLSAALYGAGDSYKTPFVIYAIGAIWFLWATFWSCSALRLLLEVKPVPRLLAVGLIFWLSCWSRKAFFWFPLSIQAGGCALLFMYIGYLGKEIIPEIRNLSAEIRTALTAMAAWTWVMFMVQFKSFWLVHCDYGRGVTDIIGSLCACSCLLLISEWIGKKCAWPAKGLAFLGQHSLIVLCLHIVELNTFPWTKLAIKLFGEMTDTQLLGFKIAAKFLWIVPMTFIIVKIGKKQQ